MLIDFCDVIITMLLQNVLLMLFIEILCWNDVGEKVPRDMVAEWLGKTILNSKSNCLYVNEVAVPFVFPAAMNENSYSSTFLSVISVRSLKFCLYKAIHIRCRAIFQLCFNLNFPSYKLHRECHVLTCHSLWQRGSLDNLPI